MKTIFRNHNFTNRLNLVRQGRKYYSLFHEKSDKAIKVQRTNNLDNAFNNENWNAFLDAEANYYGGSIAIV